MVKNIHEDKNLMLRHEAIELAEHWIVAASGLLLILTGLFQLPVAARFNIIKIPGFAWSANYITSLHIHYMAAAVFTFAASFHLVNHALLGEKGMLPKKGDVKESIAVIKSFFGKGEEPPMDKYLPEQRIAYVGMAAIMTILILSGIVKTYKNLFAPDLANWAILWATWLHNVSFLLFILAFLAHIGAILLKPNLPMARGIFTGYVRLDYAMHRHPIWYARVKNSIEPSRTRSTVVNCAENSKPDNVKKRRKKH
jgi:cytochrome b subunit of formate dehydrogenase